MADQRSYRPAPAVPEPADMARRPRGPNDPLAELARLIGQTDPFGDSARSRGPASAPPPAGWQENAAQHGYADPNIDHHLAGDLAAQYQGYGQAQAQPAYSEHAAYAQPAAYAGYAQHDYGADAHAQQGYPAGAEDYGAPYAGGQGYGHEYGDAPSPAEQEDYVEPAPPRRRKAALLAGAATVLLLGGVAVFGYRSLGGGSAGNPNPPVIEAKTTPTKVAPVQGEEPASSKLIYDRVGAAGGAGERVVSREEKPVAIKDTAAGAPQPFGGNGGVGAGGPASPALASQALGPSSQADARKVRTVAIKPNEPFTPPDAATARASASSSPFPPPPQAARPSSPFPPPQAALPQRNAATAPDAGAPMALTPGAATAARAVPQATAGAPGAYVQLSSHPTEAEAQSSFRGLQGKFSSVLSGRPLVVRRADIPNRGTFYRATVGPFAAVDDASALCSQLKAAGGSCIVQRN